MWRIVLMILFFNVQVQSMELKSVNSCQTALLPDSATLCPHTLVFDSELYIYQTFSKLIYLTSMKYPLTNEYFHLEYSRDEIINSLTFWRPYRLLNSQFNPPIIVKHLRIKTNHCLQLQLFGCVFTDGVISYNVLQGTHQLEDDTYDGFYNEKHRYLYDGLGQLIDGQTGPDNYQDEQGFQWVGWRKTRFNKSNYSLSIQFLFDYVRNFSRLTIHANNFYPKKIYVFRSLKIDFFYKNSSTSLVYHHQRDDQFEMARPIMINLQYHLASQIQIHFEFDSPSMLISEFTFDSQIIHDDISVFSSTTINLFSIYILICISIVSLIALSPLIIWLFYRMFFQQKKNLFLSSLSTISSTEFDSHSSTHRYATIASSYGKFHPTTNFLRLPNKDFEGICGNSSFATERTFSMNFDSNMFQSIEHIRIETKINNRYQLLGEGEIYKGELQIEQSSVPISIRRILPNASIESKISFLNEISVLTTLCHPHLLHAYGLCSQPSLSILIESFDSSTMDLYQYLQYYKYEQIDEQTFPSTVRFFAQQISSALTYLESLHIFHRDLATRNCLISSNLHIKLQDLALSNEIYADDYVLVTIDGKFQTRRPIRWCAWETICLNRFSNKSDVFSFGVLIWEILTLADRPYGLLTDDEVLSNLENNSLFTLSIPNYARDFNDLLLSCWNRNDLNRPNFSFIHQYLTEMNDINYQQIII